MSLASDNLELAIIGLAPSYVVADDAPDDWPSLQLVAPDVLDGAPIPVSPFGCERTIYSSPEVNHAFRAWHDYLHIQYDADFTVAGEQIVHSAHMLDLGRYADIYGLTADDFAVLTADTLGQVMYWYRNRRYVEDQEAFVSHVLRFGLANALMQRF